MKTLEAATIQLETLDFEEGYLIKMEMAKRKASYTGEFLLESIRNKRRVIYENTYLK